MLHLKPSVSSLVLFCIVFICLRALHRDVVARLCRSNAHCDLLRGQGGLGACGCCCVMLRVKAALAALALAADGARVVVLRIMQVEWLKV